LGRMKLIRVETGNVGYAYKNGELSILPPGFHLIVPPDRFGSILSTQQQTLTLPEGVHESGDNVPLKIRADVFYSVVDPRKALTKIKSIVNQIRETAVSTLAGIIRSSTLNEIANSSKVTHSKTDAKGAGAGSEPSAPPFFQHVHDKFMGNLHTHMLEWGINLHNIRIESLKINDAQLASAISRQAVQVSQQEAKYRMLQKQTEVIQVEANNKKLQRLKEMEATTDIIRAKARADAEAIVMRAEAEKTSRELIGAGEAKYAEYLNSTPLGAELAKMKLQVDMMKGIEKVAYVPHLPDILQKTAFTTPLPNLGKSKNERKQ